MDFKNLNKEELEKLLKDLNLYNDLRKKLWKRWTNLFKRNINSSNLLEVEYFSSISEDIAYDNALEIYMKVFNISPKRNEIRFISKDSIQWWIKVYKDDLMVDFSFSKVENILKKTF